MWKREIQQKKKKEKEKKEEEEEEEEEELPLANSEIQSIEWYPCVSFELYQWEILRLWNKPD